MHHPPGGTWTTSMPPRKLGVCQKFRPVSIPGRSHNVLRSRLGNRTPISHPAEETQWREACDRGRPARYTNDIDAPIKIFGLRVQCGVRPRN